jgi:hypothetical protein
VKTKKTSEKLLLHGFLPPIQNPKSEIQNYLITLSARADKFGGIVRPICWAVFELITNSNSLGASTCTVDRPNACNISPARIATHCCRSVALVPLLWMDPLENGQWLDGVHPESFDFAG